ncbi:hypothetical protein D3C71_1599510 [compost metagenome]
MKIEKKREADRRKADEDYWAAQRAQVAKDGEVVRKFIKAVSVSFTHDIKNGREPAPVYLPINILELLNHTKWHGMYSYTGLPEFHLNHERVVQELFNWGRSHGLLVRLSAVYVTGENGEVRRWTFTAMSAVYAQ